DGASRFQQQPCEQRAQARPADRDRAAVGPPHLGGPQDAETHGADCFSSTPGDRTGRQLLIDWRSPAAGPFPATPRVQSLTPELAKGLEFDLVVLIDPEAFGNGIQGAVDRYVAMTLTRQLVILRHDR